MEILNILKIISCVLTILTGLFALLRPLSAQGFTGLKLEGSRGITEIRAVMGGFFIALGAAPLFLQAPATYTMLGIAYLGVALVRLVSIFIDKSAVSSNWISLAVEIVLGVLLIL